MSHDAWLDVYGLTDRVGKRAAGPPSAEDLLLGFCSPIASMTSSSSTLAMLNEARCNKKKQIIQKLCLHHFREQFSIQSNLAEEDCAQLFQIDLLTGQLHQILVNFIAILLIVVSKC